MRFLFIFSKVFTHMDTQCLYGGGSVMVTKVLHSLVPELVVSHDTRGIP